MSVKQGMILVTDRCNDSVILTPAQARRVVRIFDRQDERNTILANGVSACFAWGEVRVQADEEPIVFVTKRDISRLREILGGSHV